MAGDIPGINGDRGKTLQAISNVSPSLRVPVNLQADPATGALLVSGTFSPPALQNVNLTQVGSVAFSVISGTYGKILPAIGPHDSGGFSDAYANNPQNYVDENFNQIIQGVFPFMYNGATWDRVRGDTANGLDVDVTRLPTLANVTTVGTVTTVATVTSLSQFAGTAIATSIGATTAGTLRTVVANGTGRTLLSTGGSASSSGNNTLVAAGTNRLKVYAFSLSTTATTSTTCIFQSGAGGTELWRVVLQAPTSVSTGANLVVQPPAWLFATASATLLNLNLSGANTVHWSVSYYDEA